MHIISYPPLPYWGHIPDGGVHPGSVIQISGHVPHHCHKMEINLFTGHEMGHHAEHHSNIALQIRVKPHKRKVILNSRHYGHWGRKEKHHNWGHHFGHGCTFDIQIVVEHGYYRIRMDGHEVATYYHRVPYHEIRILNIEGHLDVHRLEYRHSHYNQTTVYPSSAATTVVYPSAPSAPYYPPSQTVSYPAPPAYVAPVITPGPPIYVPTAVAPNVTIIEDHHHTRSSGGLLGAIADNVFGHNDHHHHHHKHHHHHGHHY
ncbi:galectin-4-like [Oppia nitens]|uniref:galectin-4-like n=1 Tax=Oppia nitens TaxID=1686743 RepID=UPI0023DB3987|nr:galectin-4-like [Oppia nitens]